MEIQKLKNFQKLKYQYNNTFIISKFMNQIKDFLKKIKYLNKLIMDGMKGINIFKNFPHSKIISHIKFVRY